MAPPPAPPAPTGYAAPVAPAAAPVPNPYSVGQPVYAAAPAAAAAPPTPTIAVGAQARQLLSGLDPTGWRPTLTILGVILAMVVGSTLFNAIIPTPQSTGPGGQPLPPGSTLDAGPLRIPLAAGWQIVPPRANVLASIGKGSVQIDLVSVTITGATPTAANVYAGYMGIIGQGTPGFGSTQASSIGIGPGIPAARGTYQGLFGQSQLEGDVTAFVTGTDGWVWDVYGAQGTLGTLLGEARQMIGNVQIR